MSDFLTAGTVVAVCRSAEHGLHKQSQDHIQLLQGLGVADDTHLGSTVQHRSRVARDPSQPNLRQVHLIACELHDELNAMGFSVGVGDLGENVTTRDVDLLGLSTGDRLRLGAVAVIEITGLRNPCLQLDRFQRGLMAAVLGRDERGAVVRRCGVMAVVVSGGTVRPGDAIIIERPEHADGPDCPLGPV